MVLFFFFAGLRFLGGGKGVGWPVGSGSGAIKRKLDVVTFPRSGTRRATRRSVRGVAIFPFQTRSLCMSECWKTDLRSVWFWVRLVSVGSRSVYCGWQCAVGCSLPDGRSLLCGTCDGSLKVAEVVTRVGGFPGQAAARRWVRTRARTRAHRLPSWGPGERGLYASKAYGLARGPVAGGRQGRTGGTRDSPMSWSGCSAGPGTVPGYLIKIARPMVCTAGCPTAIPDPLQPALFYSFNLPLRFYWSGNRICPGHPPIAATERYPKF